MKYITDYPAESVNTECFDDTFDLEQLKYLCEAVLTDEVLQYNGEETERKALNKLVKDIRTNFQSTNPEKVLNGEIDDFLSKALVMSND